MTPSKQVPWRSAVLSMLVVTALLMAGCTRDDEASAALQHKLEQAAGALKPGQTLSMADMNPGEWDSFFLFAPYTPNSTIRAALGGTLPQQVEATRLEERDDIHLLVFTAQQSARLVAVIPRSRVDFAPDGAGKALPRNAARFRRADEPRTLLFWVGS